MINMQQTKTKHNELNAKGRISNFDEVNKGYTDDEALNEANRCLNCPTRPCVAGCPVHNNIPEFIASIKQGDISLGAQILSQTTTLPFVCSRVCNQAKQCEEHCTRGIKGESVAIGMLERYITDKMGDYVPVTLNLIPSNGKKVAIIGAGPSGLACAEKLVERGYAITIYDQLPFAGGLLVYGIPTFRLPRSKILQKISMLRMKGVSFILNTKVGTDISFSDIRQQNDFVYIALGADAPKKMNIPGEELKGVYTSNDYLLRLNVSDYYSKSDLYKEMTAHKKVVVVGGGNVAMDTARVARRHGADVTIVYRRSQEEMPARPDELKECLDEGVNIQYLTNPLEILGSNHVEGIKCIRMELGPVDSSNRRKPIPVANSEFVIECDALIYAIGSGPDKDLMKNAEVAVNSWGGIEVNENYQTSIPNVFAGGDALTGPNTVVHAMRDGLKVAEIIIRKM